MDWNNDGKKDLLTGENAGYVRIYLNTGSDANPTFTGYTYLQQGGGNFDCGSYSVPWVVDWNNDNKKDVLCGESGGKVWLLINTGTDANPVFDTKVYLKDGGGNLDPGGVTSPAVADWNRDGKKDLLVGETYGEIFYYENTGTDENPVFNGSVKLQADSSTLDVGYYARPIAVDFDGDNVLDILTGDSNGYLNYFHAMGPLSMSQNSISASTGDRIPMHLDAGAANAGRNYLILGSTSGTSPGIPLPGGLATLPLNWDSFTDLTWIFTNTPVFDNFFGTLDGNGEADAMFDTTGPIPGTAGTTITFAYASDNPWDYVSNAANIEVIP